MNRRHLAVVAVVIAVPLFTIGLVSPVPDYEPQLELQVNHLPDGIERDGISPVKYRNLSTAAQQLFDTAANNGENDLSVPMTDAPTSWATLVSKDVPINRKYVQKNGKFYIVDFSMNIPAPSFGTLMFRLGPLLGAVGLGTLAGVLILTSESR